MLNNKGFTLIEIIVVLIIVGVLTAIALPNYYAYQMQQAILAAQNNLITIYGAEKNFYFNNGYYCTTSFQNNTCADSLGHLNLPANLNLNITDPYFTYKCTDNLSGSDGNDGSSFLCVATNVSSALLKLNLTNSPLYLSPGLNGGATCTYNPNCTGSAYCPRQLIPC